MLVNRRDTPSSTLLLIKLLVQYHAEKNLIFADLDFCKFNMVGEDQDHGKDKSNQMHVN